MKVHLSVTRPGPFGGTLTTSLCGRLNAQSRDGMNLGGESEVTCKFCLAIMAARRAQAERKERAHA